MALPLIPVAIAIGSGAAGVGGAVTGFIGVTQVMTAQSQMLTVTERYDERYATHRVNTDSTVNALRALGDTQERALEEVIFRMRDFLERHNKTVLAEAHLILDGFSGTRLQADYRAELDLDVTGWLQGAFQAAALGNAVRTAVRAAVVQFARAGTGRAIYQLNGAALRSATLAVLGGGTLASGGGGTALGATMLHVATAGPVLLAAGTTVKLQGTKALTSAETLRTEVEIEIAKLDALDELFRGVRQSAWELNDILLRLIAEATAAIDVLDGEGFDIYDDSHVKRLQIALLLVMAVRVVATTPVANEDYSPNEDTEKLLIIYRSPRTERTYE